MNASYSRVLAARVSNKVVPLSTDPEDDTAGAHQSPEGNVLGVATKPGLDVGGSDGQLSNTPSLKIPISRCVCVCVCVCMCVCVCVCVCVRYL